MNQTVPRGESPDGSDFCEELDTARRSSAPGRTALASKLSDDSLQAAILHFVDGWKWNRLQQQQEQETLIHLSSASLTCEHHSQEPRAPDNSTAPLLLPPSAPPSPAGECWTDTVAIRAEQTWRPGYRGRPVRTQPSPADAAPVRSSERLRKTPGPRLLPAVSKRFGWCLSAVSPPESHGVEAAETVGPDATSRVNDVGGGWVLTVAVAKGKSAVMNNVCKSEEGMEGGEGVKDWLCGGHRSEPPSNRFTKSKHLLRGRSALNHSTTEGNRYCSDCCCGETVVPPQTRRFSGAHLVSNH
ncbi:hypothetical protein FQA47_010788 [Oryzias melastigma]|uniref:Uncharacterized protein n=1 Tax=Oryzias melastigma TaxID=30732 RepID=A0A834EZ93_ORYME|nr:hypothetical protein FQA47_010788 [Oryzias melastigma]